MALSKIANSAVETSQAFVFTANSTLDGVHSGVTGNNFKVTANTTLSGTNTLSGSTTTISSANTLLTGAHNNVVSANTVFQGHVLFEGTAKSVGTTTGFSSATAVSTDAQQTFTKAQVPSTSTATLASTSGVLDYDTHQNFILTLTILKMMVCVIVKKNAQEKIKFVLLFHL